MVVGEPIVDAQGHVLVAAGTRTNPLDVVSLSQPLLFFDGRDAAQVRQAKALIERYGGKVKPILTAGSYLDLMRRWRIKCLLRPTGGPGAKTRHHRGAGPGLAGREAPAHRCVGANQMSPLRSWLVVAVLALAGVDAARAATCEGKFVNPLTDICWSCVFPLSIGAATVASLGQEDIANPPSPVCACPGIPPRVGLSLGFWEPARQIDVTRQPFCLVSLGGISLNPGIPAPQAAQNTRLFGHASSSFYQAHYYTNPVLYWLEVLLDFPCLEKGSFDIAYLTEVDPLWNDDELTLILNPDAVLFANPIAQAACAADCVAATLGLRAAAALLVRRLPRAASIPSTVTSPCTWAACRRRC